MTFGDCHATDGLLSIEMAHANQAKSEKNMSNPFLDNCNRIGAGGGTVNTNGMNSAMKEKVDKAVSDGRNGK